MPRLNTNAEALHRLTEVGVHDDRTGTFGNTTVAANVAAGNNTVQVASMTNFADTDYLRIGRTDWNKINGAPSGNNITLKRPLEFAHVIGEAVVETIDTPIGEVTTDGVEFDSQTEEISVKVGTSRAVYLYVPGGTEQTLKFSMVNFSLENLAEAFGLNPATRITGSGNNASDPYILTINPANFAEQPARCWYFNGLREDGKTVRVECWAAKVYSAKTTIKVVTGEPTVIPITIRVMGLVKVFHY